MLRATAGKSLYIVQWGRIHTLGMTGGAALAAYAIMSSLRLAEQEHFELFHIYYQPLLVMLAMLWMWSLDVRAFEQRRIAYSVCFSPQDQQFLLSSQQLFQVRSWRLCTRPQPCSNRQFASSHD